MPTQLRAVALCLLAVTACEKGVPREDPEAKKPPAATPAAVTTPASLQVGQEDDPALRRGYFAADMKLADCIKAQEDGTLEGHDCESGIVVFGPYVGAPPNSEVRLVFDVVSTTPIVVASDMVSMGGKRSHGAIDEQEVAPGQARHLGYRVHVFDGTSGLEARIGIRTTAKASFKITNLALTVQ